MYAVQLHLMLHSLHTPSLRAVAQYTVNTSIRSLQRVAGTLKRFFKHTVRPRSKASKRCSSPAVPHLSAASVRRAQDERTPARNRSRALPTPSDSRARGICDFRDSVTLAPPASVNGVIPASLTSARRFTPGAQARFIARPGDDARNGSLEDGFGSFVSAAQRGSSGSR